MQFKSTCQFIGAALLALPTLTQAQPDSTAHYVPGVEGIKAASLPPPGVYLRDYNAAYYAEQVNGPTGDKFADQKVFVYANIPRLIWITPVQVLGGNLGVDALVPLQYTYVQGLGQTFGVGDLFFEGTWSRHLPQFDLSLGYGAWAPTGDSNTPTEAGKGFWTHMLTAGATWYVDADKKWAASALGRYEINQEHQGFTVGEVLTIEGGLSYALCKNIDIGPVGYYQQKVTSDSGLPASTRGRVAAIGPEISAFCPSLGVFASLRYCYEFMAEDRFQGHTFALTLTKRF